VIVVLGRPGLDARDRIGRPAGRVALAAVKAGARVELVGSVGDDSDGEQVVLGLGQGGVGHAALLRDPAGSTPHDTADPDTADEEGEPRPAAVLPRLDAADVDLGLHYLAECHVLVVAEPLEPAALEVAVAAARYHDAKLIALVEPGTQPAGLPESATVLETPDHDDGAFGDLVGTYAALLESGRPAADAWHDALTATGWESAPT
jgi:sugar/nucleoside kinase (ribokinase family)